LALKLAELRCLRAASQLSPILLLDDVSSELDPDRTGAVYSFLNDTESQVFVTTTRPDLLTLEGLPLGGRADFAMRAGTLSELSRPSTQR
jgi:DNA replication and repair protein RecF